MTHFPCKAAKLFLLSAVSSLVVAGAANAEGFVPDPFDGSAPSAGETGFFETLFFDSADTQDTFVPDPFDGSFAAAQESDFFTDILENTNYVPDPFNGDPAAQGEELDPDFSDEYLPENFVPDPFDGSGVQAIPEEEAPEAAEPASLAESVTLAAGVGKTTGSELRMRAEPTSDSAIVTTLNKNSTLAILEYSTEDWYKVSFNGLTGYISTAYLSELEGGFEAPAKVVGEGVLVREAPSDDADVKNTIDNGAIVTCTGFENGWYAVKCKYGTEGYIRSDYLALTTTASSDVVLYSSSKGSNIVATAKKYLGVRYVYGGASPRAFDCSGFTMYVFRQYGYSLPHTASGQWSSGLGTRIYSKSALQPGDLVFFNDPSKNLGRSCSHVGIYVGNGQFIHASSGGRRVMISSLSESYYRRYYKGGLHIA